MDNNDDEESASDAWDEDMESEIPSCDPEGSNSSTSSPSSGSLGDNISQSPSSQQCSVTPNSLHSSPAAN
eukprot:752891-Hanusia_phi.AAC.1